MIEFGLSTQEFQTRYFEQQVYLRKNALPISPLQWSDLDALLQTVEPDETVVQLFHNGQVPPNVYISNGFELGRQRRRINKHGLYGLMRTGATMVINRMENYCVAAKRLCTEVGRFAGHQTTSNAYVSFGGKGSFGKHWDTHDVFAIQLTGRKRWQVFAPTWPLPLSSHTSELRQHECPATPVFDGVLAAGDMLYIPRGWWHQTIPFDEASFHLSVGVYVPTLLDYIMWTCSRQLPLHVQARKGLGGRADHAADLSQLMTVLNKAVIDPQQLLAFNQDLAARERLSSEFDVGLFLDKADAQLSDHAVISCNSCYPLQGERAEVAVNGAQLKLDPVSRTVLMLLSTTLSLPLGKLYEQLPQFSPTLIRVAVQDLARHELLHIDRRV